MNLVFLLVLISLFFDRAMSSDDEGVEIETESNTDGSYDKQINDVLKPYINQLKEVKHFNLKTSKKEIYN